MPDEEITQKELARRLDLEPRTIRKHTAAGVIPRLKNKKYPWPESKEAWLQFKMTERERRYGRDDLDLNRERARKTAVEADLAELKLAELRGELIPVGIHEERCGLFVDNVNSVLRSIPGRWAPELLRKKSVAELRAALKRLVNDMLAELADGGRSSTD